jgi:Uma2 family endonuclease
MSLESSLKMTAATLVSTPSSSFSLEDWLQNPPEHTEWINGELVEKNNMTLKHSRIQAKLATYWRNYLESTQQGGEVYTEVPCRTHKQGRIPDVAYLTPELVAKYGNEKVLPQSFPLIAEIISPTDEMEAVFEKVNEYLASSGQEIWLVLPENQWILVITQEKRAMFTTGEMINTQLVLPGFQVAVDQLFA